MESAGYITSRIILKNAATCLPGLARDVEDVENEERAVSLPRVTNGSVVLRDITNGKFVQDEEGKSKHKNCRWKNEVARERWKILAKALLKPKKNLHRNCKTKDISVRRFATFDLVTASNLDKVEKADGCWLRYTAKHCADAYAIEIRHLEQKLTPKELMGFNNTGNICIWPSEEVLAHYVLRKIGVFEGKEVLEVGGGMTCLAGMMLAKYGKVKGMELTDGNLMSVENVKMIIWRNQLDRRRVVSFQLDWVDHRLLRRKYDVVLSSDCLFFDETRGDLVETIWRSLRDDGVALVMAPRRGNTLDCFVKAAAQRGFNCALLTYYDEIVWKQHLKFKEFAQEYDEDLHYPVLLLLTKSTGDPPRSMLAATRTDYWVSQGRKFCEFCKCSIADNKASIQFHESGKKHKDNVAKRLTAMQKKAAKDAKDAASFDKDLKRIEAAAVKAYMSDVKSNADFTSQLIQQGLETLPEVEYVEPEPSKPKQNSPKKQHGKKLPPTSKKWMEAVSEEGKTYYWNAETGESAWEAPEGGYLSLEEQQKQKSRKSSKGSHKPGKKFKKHGKFGQSKHKSKPSGAGDSKEKEEVKIELPLPYVPPFGKWKAVEPPKEQKIDLQLPKQDWVEITVPKAKEESERGFKEKTSAPGFVSSSQGETGFKKRKIGADVKRNMRQRLSDD